MNWKGLVVRTLIDPRSSVLSPTWSVSQRFPWVRCLIGTLLLAALAGPAQGLSIPPADMSTWAFNVPAAPARYTFPVFGTLNDNVYTSRVVTHPSVTYPVTYIMGDVHERYVQAVLQALFATHRFGAAGSAPGANTLTLRLIALHNVHTVGKGFATRDITDLITASWGLFDPEGVEVYRFHFSGTATSNSGLGKGYGPRGRERTGLAYQDLLNNTVLGLAAAEQLQRVEQIPELYVHPAERVIRARLMVRGEVLPDASRVLSGMRWLAAERGDHDLYQVAAHEIARRNLTDLSDTSALLHTVIRSDNEALFSEVLRSSRTPDVMEHGRSPLQQTLIRGQDARAVALVRAGARPQVNAPGDVYLAAELNFALAGLLVAMPQAASVAYAAARRDYDATIAEAQEAIRRNEIDLWATRWARILAPALQGALAGAEARAVAEAGARQTGLMGFGTAVYRPAEFDTSTPKGAITYLNDLVRRCNEQLARIP
ncbi:MAG TPA: hypothetical protein PK681_10160 [Steroidobacteraceae bacterium]|nr:hypothetical protein [Steroidobacteraceae bacterium]HQX77089.1 hypothetical protein [Steroidobacteraceae bacterium]HQZ80969.1 hypothetical protein [Steroidobacteraceae bacterium]